MPIKDTTLYIYIYIYIYYYKLCRSVKTTKYPIEVKYIMFANNTAAKMCRLQIS